MFNTFFSKRKVKKLYNFKKSENLDETVNFSDLKGQNFVIYVTKNGNSNMLILQDSEGRNEIILDKDQAFLLSLLLNEYGKTQQIVQTINILKEKE